MLIKSKRKQRVDKHSSGAAPVYENAIQKQDSTSDFSAHYGQHDIGVVGTADYLSDINVVRDSEEELQGRVEKLLECIE
ncbi:unnamed protein product [Hymenolepis diminuta]|uniref:Uncharacterized protein n=1 Tax=Hymenolepis diminuta TaxID=6216 RepID=A0A0R3S7L8_HYMDI|nr:unnamed protein product [Hymenolepis diminuta]